MRRGLRALVLILAMGMVVVACSDGERDESDGRDGTRNGSRETRTTELTVEDELGHQAYQRATRLVVPASGNSSLDRVARVAAGLGEDRLGAYIFVQERPGEEGNLAWRDVADEEPDGHQLAYVTEGLLAKNGGARDIGPEDFEMVARTDVGAAVLVVRGDQEAESFQTYSLENLKQFLDAARQNPGMVEVADPGPGTVYRAGTLALEREAGVDLSPKSPSKAPAEAIYDGDVEAALLPADRVLTDVLAGELRPLAVFSNERTRDLPNVPTAKELGHDVVVPVFGGVAAPAGTPPETVDELGRAFQATSSSRAFAQALVGTAREPAPLGPDKFSGYLDQEPRGLSKQEY